MRRFHDAKPQGSRNRERCVLIRYRMPIGRAVAAFAIGDGALSVPFRPSQPSPQGLLDVLFGGINTSAARHCPRASAPMPIHSVSAMNGRTVGRLTMAARPSTGGGPSSGYCVRTCDGTYFPVKSSGNMSATELCQVVLSGRQDQGVLPAARSTIRSPPTARATPISTTRSSIASAAVDELHLQRQATAYGLATLNPNPIRRCSPAISSRPTTGFATYNGNEIQAGRVHADRAIRRFERMAQRLMSIKVTPAPPRAEVAVPPARKEPARATTAAAFRDSPPPRRRATAPRSAPAIQSRTDG